MTSQYRHRRTSNPATPVPNPIEPGEIAVNTANRQLSVGDAAVGVVGQPLALLAVRIFDARAIYAIGDLVVNAGSVFRAKVANGPGAFTPGQWDSIAGSSLPSVLNPLMDAAAPAPGVALPYAREDHVHPRDTSREPAFVSGAVTDYFRGDKSWHVLDKAAVGLGNVDNTSDANKPISNDGIAALMLMVQKAGDTMTGQLTLPTGPAAANAVRKDYVDALVAAKSSVIVADTPPAGVADNTLWFESDSGLMFVRYNDGNTTQWVAASGNALADAASDNVIYGRKNSVWVPAAPADAMGWRGLQWNNTYDVDQAAAGIFTLTNGTWTYLIDGWRSIYQNTGAVFQSGKGSSPFRYPFDNGLQLISNTKITTLAAGDFAVFSHMIEGYRWKHLGFGNSTALPVTIGFWVQATIPGIASLVVRNNNQSRNYVTTFTINAANTPQWVTVTIPGDVAGTWQATNGIGAEIMWSFACGTTYQGAPNVWGSAIALGATGMTNFFPTNGNAVILGGVTVLPGTQAPSAAQSYMSARPRDQEVLVCQRYMLKIPAQVFFAPGQLRSGGTAAYHSFSLPTPMRSAPVFSYPGNTQVWSGDNATTMSSLTCTLPSSDLNSPVLAIGTGSFTASVGAQGAACFLYMPTVPAYFDARM